MGYFEKTIKNKGTEFKEFILSENHTLKGLEIIDKPINDEAILANITNPYTSKPYDGLLVGGVFAEMDIVNNNNRFYTEDNYVPAILELRRQIFSNRGVFGTLEHPSDYGTNSKNISHKLVDIYYNPQDKKVYGLILILNTPKGLIAQEIFKSGGSLAVSARGAGEAITTSNGSIKSVLKLIITYDLVYHSGFSNAIMEKSIDINKLNVTKFTDEFGDVNELFESNNYFSVIQFKDGTIQPTSEFVKLYESQQQNDEEKMQENEPYKQKQIINKLQKSVDEELNESQRIQFRQQQIQKIMFETDRLQQNKLNQSLKKRLDGAYFDGSGGFVKQGIGGIPTIPNEI